MTADQRSITVAAPGNSLDVMLYDESANGTTNALAPTSSQRRIAVNLWGDQIVTVFHEILLKDGGTWRAVNGAGDATTASTLFDKDYYFRAGLNRIRVHAGATGPTPGTWEARARTFQDRVSPT